MRLPWQRWLVVQSQKRRESDLKKLEKEQQKEKIKAEKQLRQFSRQKFACIPDARQAAKKLLKTSKFHQLTDIKIEPCPETASTYTTTVAYQVQATVSPCTEKIQPIRASAGRFRHRHQCSGLSTANDGGYAFRLPT